MKTYMYLRHFACRLIVILPVILLGTSNMWAQTEFEEGYSYLYSSNHRVKVRKPVECISDHQNLWNGTHVQIIDDTIYIYRDSTYITHSIQVWLEHNGYYLIQGEDESFQLIDPSGHPTGVQGDELVVLWDGTICVYKDNKYYLYTPRNQRVGNIVADRPIEIYYNGCFCYHNNQFYCVASPEGAMIENSYSDTPPELMDNGMWRCKRNGRAFYVDVAGYIYY